MPVRRGAVLPITVCLLVVILLGTTSSTIKAGYEEEISPKNVLRLRVIANSNEDSCLELKERVARAVVSVVRPHLKEADSLEAAEKIVREIKPTIRNVIDNSISGADFDGKSKVVIIHEKIPKTDYGDFKMPAGVYQTLRISIGASEGDNWWCVLFPTLCLDISAQQKAKSSSDDKSYNGPRLRWAIKETLYEVLESADHIETSNDEAITPDVSNQTQNEENEFEGSWGTSVYRPVN